MHRQRAGTISDPSDVADACLQEARDLRHNGTADEAEWLTCVDDIAGNAGTPSDCYAAVTGGSISVSADGNTLTISETGMEPADSGTLQSFYATCKRTAVSQVQCGPEGSVILETPDGSEGNDAGSTAPPPECIGNQDCGGCARCQSGMCIYCPIGTLGICTC